MQPRANLQVKLAETVSDRAANPPRGAVERREEAVASRVHLPSPEPRELAADDVVVFFEQLPPGAVAEVGSMGSRIDDIGEQHGREHPIRLSNQLSRVADIREERLQLAKEPFLVADQRLDVMARKLHETRAADVVGQVAPTSDIESRYLRALEHERRHLDEWQYVANVDVEIRP
jgi:hypothetical protein